ncbi:MAG: hypothetical protein PVF15_10225 [Candidatus Bathyarchaeota archaeon]
MKGDDKKKPRGMKHKIREEKKREQRLGLVVTLAILIAIVAVSGLLIHSMLTSQRQETSSLSEPKAAIVDQLSLTAPNQTFIRTATNILEQAGFTVDYYPGEQVTVEFYKNLPTHGYELIILRVHSALVSAKEPPVTLFTSEPYSKTKYVHEQLEDRVGWVTYRFENGTPKEPTYFGISPLFVKQSLIGRFQDTIIVMMGCSGLTHTDMTEAFIEKGAKAYISWSNAVLASHTDLATAHLLQHFLKHKLALQESVQETLKEVGTDPAYESFLIYYPPEAGDYTILNIIGYKTTNTRETAMTQAVPEKGRHYEDH